MSPNEDQESQDIVVKNLNTTEKPVIDVQPPNMDSTKSTDINIDSESGNLSSASSGSIDVLSDSQPNLPQEVVEQQDVATEANATEEPEPQLEPPKTTDESTDKEHFASDSEPSNDNQQKQPVMTEQKTKKLSNTPKVAIIIAAIIGIVLIIVSIIAYTKMQDDDKSETATEQGSQVAEKATVTDSDVNSAIQDIEGEINKTNDAVDIPTEESVGDQSLGL